MKTSTERQLLRWFHMLASIPLLGYIYGPVASIPEAARMVRWVLMPLVILSGLWMWRGYWVKQHWRRLTQPR